MPTATSSEHGEDGHRKAVEKLEEYGGLCQPEFSAQEERTELSISCLSALRKMNQDGCSLEAKQELDAELEKIKKDPIKYAEGCCIISELLNRWGAASASYDTCMMATAVEYADEAIRGFESCGKAGKTASLETALFWKALNAATLGGNGGTVDKGSDYGEWTSGRALQEAEHCHDKLVIVVANRRRPGQSGRLAFVRGIVKFCSGNAMRSGYIEGGVEEGERQHEEASGLFLAAHRSWCDEYGEEHPDTVKAVTMLGVLNGMLRRHDQAITWTRREYALRMKLWGIWHPRTIKCKEALKALLGDDAESESAFGGDHEEMMNMELAEADKYSEAHVSPSCITWETDPFVIDEKWSVESIMQMFASSGVTAAFNVPRQSLAKLIITAKGGYHASNTFHNWRHAWSVTMTSYMMIMSPNVAKYLGPAERLAVLVSTLCHDINHPGVNSDFLIKTADPMAIKFPTSNCLELHHLDKTMQLLACGSETNILVNVKEEERNYITTLIKEAILATDMGLHKHIVARLAHHAQPGGLLSCDPSTCSEETKRDLVQSIVHASDLSGQALPADIACQFGKRVLEEFHTQHEREVRENLVESAFMKDLHLPMAQAKTQLGFLHYVVAPLWQSIARLFPEFNPQYQNIMARAREIDFDNIHLWGALHGGLVAMASEQMSSFRSLRSASIDDTVLHRAAMDRIEAKMGATALPRVMSASDQRKQSPLKVSPCGGVVRGSVEEVS
mmetsp:Transcript_1785/g.3717  ORF Transcript_1785/g.3717 Transcript_1785/m.3717 type:complete len:732 (+) Transcript_1785:98-2293(+)